MLTRLCHGEYANIATVQAFAKSCSLVPQKGRISDKPETPAKGHRTPSLVLQACVRLQATGVLGLCLPVLLFFAITPAAAQDWARPLLRNLHRLDLRELGYAPSNEIPANSSAVTSLLTASDGKIYGGTSGEEAYLFVFDPATNKVRHLGRIPGQEGIHHALVEDRDGALFVGTGRNVLAGVPLTPGKAGGPKIDEILWTDIQTHFRKDPGGHLYRYLPRQSDSKAKLVGMDAEVQDLGIPVAGNAVYALAIHPAGGEIYGLTYPDGHFFVYDIAGKKYRDLGEVERQRVFHGPERDWRSLPRALVVDRQGRVFTSGEGGKLIYYDPNSRRLCNTDLVIPGDYNYVQFFSDHAVVDGFAKAASGILYGGSSDGYLFALDPEKMKLTNLGKPRAARRLRCLAVGHDGKVYLMAGERSAAWPCQAYCYDPREGGYTELGLLIVDRSPHYYRRGYQFDCMTVGQEGTLYLGESERRSHLFLYLP
jgi:outer membrane protein assembly factor BamB